MYLKYCWLEGQPNVKQEITIRPPLQENSTVRNENLHKKSPIPSLPSNGLSAIKIGPPTQHVCDKATFPVSLLFKLSSYVQKSR